MVGRLRPNDDIAENGTGVAHVNRSNLMTDSALLNYCSTLSRLFMPSVARPFDAFQR